MLEAILGSKNRERVLQFIFSKGEGYAKEIADFYDTSLDPIQKQLEKLELGGVLVSKTVGHTRLFVFNPRYAFLDELKALLQKAREYYSPKEIERIDYEQEAPPKKKEAIMKTIGEMSMEERLYIKCNK